MYHHDSRRLYAGLWGDGGDAKALDVPGGRIRKVGTSRDRSLSS